MRDEFLLLLMITVLLSVGCARLPITKAKEPQPTAEESIQHCLEVWLKNHRSASYDGPVPPPTRLQKVTVQGRQVELHFNAPLAWQPVRPETIEWLTAQLRSYVEVFVKNSELKIFAGRHLLEQYIPQWAVPPYKCPYPLEKTEQPPLVRNLNCPLPEPQRGLFNHYVALWHSHGWYYDESGEHRWKWQRPRLFTIVEDMLPMSFTIPFLIPMLEHSGAVVLCPRERDLQTNEVVVDNDFLSTPSQQGTYEERGEEWQVGQGTGFKLMTLLPDGVNPHQLGTHRLTTVERQGTRSAWWTPDIPEDGDYGVYVSYAASPERSTRAHYLVYHTGGVTEFHVNQQLGGNYWVYLGSFYFRQGVNPQHGAVELRNDSPEQEMSVSADAVKFGGGMGNVTVEGKISGYPRYTEGSKYWLQYAGVDLNLVCKFDPDYNQYTQDYVSRAEWVNYLKGAPFGPNPNREFPGLKMPVDVSLAFHTDAGITTGVVGLLTIYRLSDDKRKNEFPDGRSRWLNRELADLFSTQVIDDLRQKYSTSWTRRAIRDGNYSEIRRPNMPSIIIELLSHQNFDDLKYALDPRFRFDVARSIYKAVLSFLAYEYDFEPVVAPLPPTHLLVQSLGRGRVNLSWRPQPDPLEPSATPAGYIVYMRTGLHSGFDNGRRVVQPELMLEGLDPQELYSFKVCAFNEGGMSLAGETLCIRTGGDFSRRALIVQGFDRVGPPSYVEAKNFRGIFPQDYGVGYGYQLGFTGFQFDFDPTHPFLNNDNPGWGASYGDYENQLIPGNTFDFTIIHGDALAANGWAFDSASDEAVAEGLVRLSDYKVVDWVLGEERTTPPYPWPEGKGEPDRMEPMFRTLESSHQEKIKEYLEMNGKLFINGAYVATDLAANPLATKEDKEFLHKTLRCNWINNCGSRTNNVQPSSGPLFLELAPFHFASGLGEHGTYGVELPDSLRPAKDSGAYVCLRYEDARQGAAVAYAGEHRLIVAGFPFETILERPLRHQLMQRILTFLTE